MITVQTTLILLLSFSSVETQTSVQNQAYRKPVTVEPPEGACGVDTSRSRVEIYNYHQGNTDRPASTKQLVRCAADCGRKYPQRYNGIKIEETDGAGLELGSLECTPFKKLRETRVFEANRRKRETEHNCLTTKRLRISSKKWSYSLWIKPDQNVTREMTVFQHYGVHLTVQRVQDRFEGRIYWTNRSTKEAPNIFDFPVGQWSSVIIQYEEDGQVSSQNLDGAKVLSETMYIGASPIKSDKCELLEILQCREIGYSQTVVKGSQLRNDPEFPDFSQGQSLTFEFGVTYDPLTTYERTVITTYFCATFYPACDDQGNSRPPCPSLCSEAVGYLRQKCPWLLQTQRSEIWTCRYVDPVAPAYGAVFRKKRQGADCVDSKTTFKNNLFKGTIRDFQVFPSMLTTRQLKETVNGKFPVYALHNECMCPENRPASNAVNNSDIYCRSIVDQEGARLPAEKLRLDAALQNNTRFFSSQYITDGQVNPYHGFWVSTPGMRTVSLVVDFGRIIQVNAESDSVILILATSPPEGAIVIHRYIYGTWREWYYFAENCHEHGLPNGGVLTTSDGVKCTRYRPRITTSNFGTYYQTDVAGRSGRYSTFVDKRYEEYFLMQRIKVEFRGIPQNTKGSVEKQFHAVVELRVMGRVYENEKPCDIKCFPEEWGYIEPTIFPFGRPSGAATLPTSTTSPGPRIDYTSCQCQCREPFDRAESGPNCVPYVSRVHPNYGPIIGGTAITLTGALLGNQRPTVTFMYIRGEAQSIPCAVTTFNDTRIECRTNGTSARFTNDSFYIRIRHSRSSTTIVAKQLFVYKPDPVISRVYPLVSIVNGGIRLTVEGQHLDSVRKPQMRLRIEYNKANISNTAYQLCTVKNSTIMYCPTPNIYPYLPPDYQRRLNTDHTIVSPSGSNRSTRSVVEGTQSSLTSSLAYWLLALGKGRREKRSAGSPQMMITDDYLRTYPEIQQDNKQTAISEALIYVANPPIDEWKPPVRAFKPHWPHKEGNIAIDGERMNEGADIADYFVFIGDEECVVTDLLSNLLTCQPPKSEPKSDGGETLDGALQVTIRIGKQNIDAFEKSLGYLEYYPWWKSIAFIGIMAGVGALIILVVLAICLYRTCSRKNKDKRKQEQIYYIDAESEVSMLSRISPNLRQNIEKSLLKDPADLQIHREIGRGNFGQVYSGHFANSNKTKHMHVAVKTLRGGKDVAQIEQFLEEALVMEHFQHPNIIAILGVTFKNDTPYVILPFMTNGDLRSYTKMSNTVLQISDLVIFSAQIAKGMAYLEQKRFIHRDLAARNCMVDLDKTVKVSDFGLARDIYVDDYYKAEDKSRPLPVRWMAIESLQLGKFSHKSDVWSFGVVMWELMTRGRLPYSGVDNLDIKRLLKRGDRLEKPPHTPKKVFSLMKKCWETKPQNRPKFSDLVTLLENLLGKAKNKSKEIKSSQDYVNIPSDYLATVEAPTEENILNTYNRYSRC